MAKKDIDEVIDRLTAEEKAQIEKQVRERYGDRTLKLDEVATILGYQLNTTRRLASQDEIPVYRLRGRVRSNPIKLFQWIEGQKKSSQSEVKDGK